MNNQVPIRLPDHNPVTYGQHRRQAWWQILLPILIGAVILVALAVLSTFGSNPQVARWGNISTIFLVLPLLIVLLVTLALVAGLVYLMTRLLKILPAKTYAAQIWMEHFSIRVKGISDKIASPFFGISGGWAGLRRLFSRAAWR